MLIQYFGNAENFFDAAFYDDTSGFDPTIISANNPNRIVIRNDATGHTTAFIGTGLPRNPEAALTGTLTRVEMLDDRGNPTATFSDFSWSFAATVNAIEALVDDDNEGPLNNLFNLQPIRVDGRSANAGLEMDLSGTRSNITFLGTPFADRLRGGDGNDTIIPGASDDGEEILGSGGSDRIDLSGNSPLAYVSLQYWPLDGPIQVNVNGNANTMSVNKGALGTDTIVDVSKALRGDGLDVTGTRSADTFNVIGGPDSFSSYRGERGNDRYNVTLSPDSTVRLDFRIFDSSVTTGITMDLRTGVVDDGWGGTDQINITDNGGRLEIRGSDNADRITGSDGDDRFILQGGNDTLNAGAGYDILRYDRSSYAPGIQADLDQGTVTGRALVRDGFDNTGPVAFTHRISNVEEIWGTPGNDTMVGDARPNWLEGRDGNDRLEGRGGDDTLLGDNGNDTLIGGEGDDDIRDGDGNDRVEGGGGDDWIDVGSGQDTFVGGAGNDTLFFYTRDFNPNAFVLDVNLAQGYSDVLNGNGDFRDSVSEIEDVRLEGGISARVTGDGADNRLRTEDGNDTLIGGAGHDTLQSGSGNDRLDASGGDVESQGWGDYIRPGLGTDVILGHAGLWAADGGLSLSYGDLSGMGGVTITSGAEGSGTTVSRTPGRVNDTFTYVNFFEGSQDNDVITGSNEDRFEGFAGLGGADTIHGGGGYDQLYYNFEADYFEGVGTGIRADLAAGLVIDTQGHTDVVTGIDGIRGTDLTDWMAGSTAGEYFEGLDGNDYIAGDGAVAAYYGASVAGQVYRLYQATLDRTPDITGHANWSGRIASGERTLLEVADGFVRSPQFKAIYSDSLGNEGFVTLLYNNVLERDPDDGGLARWVGELEAGASRAQVVLGFSQSPQFVTNTTAAANAYTFSSVAANWSDEVYRLYQATLDRTPDVTGQTNWTGRLASGEFTLLEVADGFVRSPQFKATYSDSLSNEGFVTLLYNNVLERDPDDGGMARWVGELEAGASRAQVVLGFSQSPQFAANTLADVKDWMRAQGQHDRIEPGGGTNAVAGGQFADVFIFNADADGSTTVADLEAWDFIELNGFGFGSVAAARAQMSQAGNDMVFDDQGVDITFRGFALTDLTDDMILV